MSIIIRKMKTHKLRMLNEMASPKEALIDAFMDSFQEAVDKMDGDIRTRSSYSLLASASGSNMSRKPDVDFKKMVAELGEEGWTKEDLNELFSKYADDVIKMYDHRGPQTGVCDYFLYKMTNGKNVLMGYNTKDVYMEIDGDEAFFKFYYGYNRTPYGKLAMAQHFGKTVDDFLDYLGDAFVNFLEPGKSSDLLYGTDQLAKVQKKLGIDLRQFYSYDKASNTGTLDLKAAGLNIDDDTIVRDRETSPKSSWIDDEGNIRRSEEEIEMVAAGNIKDVVVAFLQGMGFEVEGVTDNNYTSHYAEGGKAQINDGVVTLKFGTANG